MRPQERTLPSDSVHQGLVHQWQLWTLVIFPVRRKGSTMVKGEQRQQSFCSLLQLELAGADAVDVARGLKGGDLQLNLLKG